MKLCNRAGLLSHESVVVDGSKFRAVNANNKSYLSSSVPRMIREIDERVERYMRALDECDKEEAKPGALSKEDIVGVLDYLNRRRPTH